MHMSKTERLNNYDVAEIVLELDLAFWERTSRHSLAISPTWGTPASSQARRVGSHLPQSCCDSERVLACLRELGRSSRGGKCSSGVKVEASLSDEERDLGGFREVQIWEMRSKVVDRFSSEVSKDSARDFICGRGLVWAKAMAANTILTYLFNRFSSVQ